jgi:predicted nucleic acid-binding protein
MIRRIDAPVAATAVENGLPVVTQDDDYGRMPRRTPRLHVIKV